MYFVSATLPIYPNGLDLVKLIENFTGGRVVGGQIDAASAASRWWEKNIREMGKIVKNGKNGKYGNIVKWEIKGIKINGNWKWKWGKKESKGGMGNYGTHSISYGY